jgi:hypothetical protein
MRAGKARSGLRAGLAGHRRWPACGKHLPFGPEVGAVCGKAARTVLCGGRSVMSVPTASDSVLLRRMSQQVAHRVVSPRRINLLQSEA